MKKLFLIAAALLISSAAYGAEWKEKIRKEHGKRFYEYSTKIKIKPNQDRNLEQLNKQIKKAFPALNGDRGFDGFTKVGNKWTFIFTRQANQGELETIESKIKSFAPKDNKRQKARKRMKKRKMKQLATVEELREAIIDLYDLHGIDYEGRE